MALSKENSHSRRGRLGVYLKLLQTHDISMYFDFPFDIQLLPILGAPHIQLTVPEASRPTNSIEFDISISPAEKKKKNS